MDYKHDFDEPLFRQIAKASGSKQAWRDVGFVARNVFSNKGGTYLSRLYIEHTDEALIMGVLCKAYFRIIGMATRGRSKGQGLATELLARAILFAKKCGYKELRTRTLDGVNYYSNRGFTIVQRKGTDYIMIKKI